MAFVTRQTLRLSLCVLKVALKAALKTRLRAVFYLCSPAMPRQVGRGSRGAGQQARMWAGRQARASSDASQQPPRLNIGRACTLEA